MHERLVGRRNFLKAALGAAAADIAFATKVGIPRHEINDPLSEKLERDAAELTPFIETKGSSFKTRQGKTITALPDSEIFARTLTCLAYSDGGEVTLNKVKSFIKERKLHISIGDIADGGNMVPSSSPSDPIKLIFGLHIVNKYYYSLPTPDDDSLIHHEVYHSIQHARNPELFQALYYGETIAYLGAGGIPGALAGRQVYRTLNPNYDSRDKMTRRKLLGIAAGITVGTAAMPVGALFAKLIGNYFEPEELQAYIQAGALIENIPGMLDNKYLQKYKGKAFTFQES